MNQSSDIIEKTALLDGSVVVAQPQEGYRFSVEALLLAHFALASNLDRSARFVEFGSGSGVISALLALGGFKGGLAVELQPSLHECTRATIEANQLAGVVSHKLADIRKLQEVMQAGAFATAIANPPYYPVGTGKLNVDESEAKARHELTCTMADVLAAARYVLPNRGRLLLVYPAARTAEILTALPRFKLHPAQLRFVHPHPHRPATSVLLDAVKTVRTKLIVQPPLIVHAASGGYGPWFDELKAACDRPREP